MSGQQGQTPTNAANSASENTSIPPETVSSARLKRKVIGIIGIVGGLWGVLGLIAIISPANVTTILMAGVSVTSIVAAVIGAE
jgi:hypothetical protein